MKLGEKLSILRKKKNISQETLANSIGVSIQDVSNWEENLSEPNRYHIVKLCEFFDVPLEYIVYDSVEKPKRKGRNKGVGFLIAGLVLFLITIISTYPTRLYEYKILGSAFKNSKDYLTIFPFNVVLVIACILFIIGVYMIIKGKKEKQ